MWQITVVWIQIYTEQIQRCRWARSYTTCYDSNHLLTNQLKFTVIVYVPDSSLCQESGHLEALAVLLLPANRNAALWTGAARHKGLQWVQVKYCGGCKKISMLKINVRWDVRKRHLYREETGIEPSRGCLQHRKLWNRVCLRSPVCDTNHSNRSNVSDNPKLLMKRF